MKINLLNDDTIQKIAAGEVVERPASIIKELVENSIDANSTEISVEIKKGGKSYIKVSDDGIGIENDQIEKAFFRHATSKISNFDDLYKIYTMGFRGEALASIVAVSKLTIHSKSQDEQIGTKLTYDNNKLVSKTRLAMNRGTTIEVEDLFEYLPVRKKFLSSDIAESNKITALMYSFAIASTGKSINYTKDNKLVFSTHKNNELLDNLRILFGKDYADNCLDLTASSGSYQISGYISNSSFYKGNRSMQYIYVNGRYIEDQDLVNLIESQYHSLIPNTRYPAFQLFIETDPKNIDINISPNKQKIKFSFADELYEEVKTSIYDRLMESQKAKEIKGLEKEVKPNFYDLTSGDSYEKILNAYKNYDTNSDDKTSSNQDLSYEMPIGPDLSESLDIIDIDDFDTEDSFDSFFENPDDFKTESKDSDPEIKAINEHFLEKEDTYSYIGSLFNKYLLFNQFDKEKLLIIDQVAARERLLFDDLSESFENDTIKTSDLLSPIIIEIGPRDFIKYLDNKSLFEDLGYGIEEFGKNTLAIRKVPYIGEIQANKDIFLNVLDKMSGSSSKEEYLEILRKKALAMAIHKKSNITEEEAIELLRRLENSDNAFSNHSGRKIQYSLTEEEFERILKR